MNTRSSETALAPMETTIITLLLVFLSSRILMDLVYIADKPSILKAYFFLFSLFLIFINIGKLINKTDLLLFTMIGIMIFYPLLFSQEVLAKQLAYNLKVLLIPLVILSCSHLDISFSRLRQYSRIVIPIALIIGFAVFLSGYTYNIFKLYSLFDNNPEHVVSQTVAKSSFLFLHGKFLIAFVGALLILNVRSNLFPLIIIFLYKNIRNHYKKIIFASLFVIAILLIISSVNSDLFNLHDFISRLITKNRSGAYAGDFAENFSSGRTKIWSFYLNHIANNFTIVNYLFGTGSLEMQGKYPLNAHNDLLNIVINFGFFGLIMLIFVYYEIYTRLDPKYRNYVAFYFLFVFITNGIIFHQSNILFLFYLQGRKPNNL